MNKEKMIQELKDEVKRCTEMLRILEAESPNEASPPNRRKRTTTSRRTPGQARKNVRNSGRTGSRKMSAADRKKRSDSQKAPVGPSGRRKSRPRGNPASPRGTQTARRTAKPTPSLRCLPQLHLMRAHPTKQ